MMELSRKSESQQGGIEPEESLAFPTPPPPLDLNYAGLLSDLTSHDTTNIHDFLPDLPRTLTPTSPPGLCMYTPERVTYIKKPPVDFLALKYWRHAVETSRQFNPSNWRFSCSTRQLLKAFYILYREYSYVCDTCLPTYMDQKNNPEIKENMLKAHDAKKLGAIEGGHGHNTDGIMKTTKQKQGGDTNLEHDAFGGSIISIRSTPRNTPRTNLSVAYWKKRICMPKGFRNSGIQSYDKIRCLHSSSMEIHVKYKVRHVRIHLYKRTTLDSKGQKKTVWSPLPIALELLLPKVQAKISKVMESCTFLADPLEVLAELRFYNYSIEACIDHFRKSMDLRDIIEEFVPKPPVSTCVSTGAITEDKMSFQMDNYEKAMVQLTECMFSDSDLLSNHVQPIASPELPALPKLMEDKGIQMSPDLFFDDEVDDLNEEEEDDEERMAKLKKRKRGLITIDSETQTNPVEKDNVTRQVLQSTLDSLIIIKNSKEHLERDIKKLKEKFITIIGLLTRQVAQLMIKLKINVTPREQRAQMHTLTEQIEGLKLRLKEEEKRRKSVFNMMQEQLGNIRVYCRCRDISDRKSMLEIPSNDTIILSIPPCEEFKFDKVFSPQMGQSELYAEFEPLVLSFIDGYNVCFITYGGEASGKTFTLVGNDENPEDHGLMQRALRTVLQEQVIRRRDWEYKINAAIVEIYNDMYTDFLSGEPNTHLHVDHGLETVYQALKNVPIKGEQDVEALLEVCRNKRRVAKTALNPASSRSHLITLIRLRGVSKIHGENFRSFLGLCDLAGFEDILKAQTHNDSVLVKEASFINRSLTAFNRVFVALKRQDPNSVAYREAKLTHLLKPFLTNSGKCCLIVTIRTDKNSIASSQNTLRFGRETRGVKLGRAKRQVESRQ